MEQRPSIGRVVHYVSSDNAKTWPACKHNAALITSINEDATVNLSVIPDGLNYIIPMQRIKQDEDEKYLGTWHWPERT